MTSKASTIEEPFFLWDPASNRSVAYAEGANLPNAVQMMTIDCLPTQLPRDASQHFGDRLLPILEELISKGVGESSILTRATIVAKGELTPPHQGLQVFLEKAAAAHKLKPDAAPANKPAPNRQYPHSSPLTL